MGEEVKLPTGTVTFLFTDIESSTRLVQHLAVTVSALPARQPDAPGWVVVLEDTSELLRAQKAAAWHEVARRIAHELKNPLTPIALSAERIARQLDRGATGPETQRILRECAVRHRTEAKFFLRVEPDELIAHALELEAPVTLYGRKAVISDLQGRALSEIVEILPPVAGS